MDIGGYDITVLLKPLYGIHVFWVTRLLSSRVLMSGFQLGMTWLILLWSLNRWFLVTVKEPAISAPSLREALQQDLDKYRFLSLGFVACEFLFC